MAERYTRLFSLDENLYCEGAPVIVRAGALLKDNQTGNVLAQIKFQNISKKPSHIKALRVAVSPMDVRGQTLGEPVEFDYLDLSIPRDGEFGQKTPIPLPDRNARGFSVAIVYAVFEDNTEIMPQNDVYQSIPRQRTLAGALQDNDIATEYARRFGGQCSMEVIEFADLWLCSCSAVNHLSETNCHSCKNNFRQLTTVDYGQLKKEFKDRMAKEAAEQRERELAAEQKRKEEEKAAEERRRREEAAAQERRIEEERKWKQIRKRLAIVAGIGIVLVSTILLYIKFILPEQTYKKAVALYEEQKYGEAKILFLEVEEYKDSKGYLNFQHISSFGNYKISYDEKGRVSQICSGEIYQFFYDKKDRINRIISQNPDTKVTLQEVGDSFFLEFRCHGDWNGKYEFNEYGILQKGKSTDGYFNVTHAYHIEMDEGTNLPTHGEKTYHAMYGHGGTTNTHTDSYTFGMGKKQDELLFWVNKNGKRTDYPIEFTFSEDAISPEIAAQNERLIMAFVLMVPEPEFPL